MKKALKKIGKAIGIILASVIGIMAVLSIITLCWGAAQRSAGHAYNMLPETPSDFKPEIRLIVFTDTHNENENVADAIDTSYELFDDDEVYAGVDAFYCLGDISSVGAEQDYKAYVKTVKEHIREETPCITIHGNHEFKNKTEYKELFSKYFDYESNNVQNINGFSCIAFSGERCVSEFFYSPKSIKWLNKAIDEAEEKADGKPVFVFQHPHPFGTVYGSTVWCNPQINTVLNGHTNIVDFSGHSHFPLNDPRSINQSSYTSVGCGAMARFELDLDCIWGQHPDGYDDAAQICIVEADRDGSVRIRGYDLLSDTYICDYYIDNVNDKEEFQYTYKNLKAHDAEPKFSPDTKATAYKNEDGEWVLSFDEASHADGYIVHEYKVVIRNEKGKKIFSDKFIDDYYIIDDDNTADFKIGKDTLESGKKYTVTIRAESAYHIKSEKVELEFTAGE